MAGAKPAGKTQPSASVPLAEAIILLGSLDAVATRARNYSNFYRWRKRQAVPGEYLVPELLARWRAGLQAQYGGGDLPRDGPTVAVEDRSMQAGHTATNILAKVQAYERLKRIFDQTEGEGPEWQTVAAVLMHIEEALQAKKEPVVVSLRRPRRMKGE